MDEKLLANFMERVINVLAGYERRNLEMRARIDALEAGIYATAHGAGFSPEKIAELKLGLERATEIRYQKYLKEFEATQSKLSSNN